MALEPDVTSLTLTAAGSLITNGSLPATFGDAPISSKNSIPLSETDSETGVTVNPTLAGLVSAITNIQGLSWYTVLTDTITSMNGASFTEDMVDAWNNIPNGLSANSFYDAVGLFSPGMNSTLSGANAFRNGSFIINNSYEYAIYWSSQVLGGSGALVSGNIVGDAKRFGLTFSISDSYTVNSNKMINSALNATVTDITYTTPEIEFTAGLAGITEDFDNFSSDLTASGKLINVESLESFGLPGQLLANMEDVGTLGPMYQKVSEIELDTKTASFLAVDYNSAVLDRYVSGVSLAPITVGDTGINLNTLARNGATLPYGLQVQIYDKFTELDKTELSQVKSILDITQDQIRTGADLFDPKKFLPTTYESLQAPLSPCGRIGYRSIYNQDGSANDLFNKFADKLSGILPDEQAAASTALARSLAQIKGIKDSDTAEIAQVYSDLEPISGLPLLQAQTTSLDPDVREWWLDRYGLDTATGLQLATDTNGTFKLSDMIGFAAGYNSTAPMTQNYSLYQDLQTAGTLDNFTNDAGSSSSSTGILQVIQYFCNNTYGPTEPTPGNWEVVIPAGVYGAGTYTGTTEAEAFSNAWINGIVPATRNLIASFTNNENVQTLARNSKRMHEQLGREYINQGRIDNQNLAILRGGDDIAQNLATGLISAGQVQTAGGAREYLERIVDYESLGGQSIIGAMREGSNLQVFNASNVRNDLELDSTTITTSGTFYQG